MADSFFPFPGRWVGGSCLIAGPLLVTTGALLRARFHFFAPQQLEAFADHPALLTAAYSCYSVGWAVVGFGLLALVHRIAAWNRTWAFWGGAFALTGLFNRIFSAGVDHMAFQMASVLGPEEAFAVVSETYKAFHVFRYINGNVMLMWPVLAIGAYRAGIFGVWRSLALASMAMLPFGTLKGTEIRSVALIGLCVALVPLGAKLIQEAPPLSPRAKLWITVLVLLNVAIIAATVAFPALVEH